MGFALNEAYGRHFSLKTSVFLNAVAITLATAVCPWGATAHATSAVVDALNAERARGCGGRPGLAVPLREEERLDRAAEKSPPSQGHSLDVLAGFRAVRWSVLRINGVEEARAIGAAVAGISCDRLLDREFTAAGVHQAGRQVTIVLAMPFVSPAPGAEAATAERVLKLVNEARAHPRACGDKSLPAAPPVRWNAVLAGVAQSYSEDMAQHNYMAHKGRDGSMVNDRVNRTAYRWRSLGENLASGMATAEAAVEGWLKSPGHCTTLMDAQYVEMGVAYAFSEESRSGMYWTQLFGRPR